MRRLTDTAWYSSRDDRTRLVEESVGLNPPVVGVCVNDDEVGLSYSIQCAALVAVNILARWCRKIVIQLPEHENCDLFPKYNIEFAELILRTARAADPYGHFALGDITQAEEILLIGSPHQSITRPYTWIDADGWIAGLGFHNGNTKPHRSLSLRNGSSPIGPSFAAALGNAELFRHSINVEAENQFSNWYSLFDFSKHGAPDQDLSNPPIQEDSDFGRILQIGCGGVGSSLDYLLAMTKWRGEIELIDFDGAEYSNCNRSLCINYDDASSTKPKVEICKTALSKGYFAPNTFLGDFSEFVEAGKLSKGTTDLLLCLANERNIWSTIQNNYPPISFHATTTLSWGVNFGRHRPKLEWCLMDRFAEDIDSNFVPPCAEGNMPQSQSTGASRKSSAVLPFLPTLASSLILAEMAKLGYDSYPVNDDFVQFSSKVSDGKFITSQRSAGIGCICSNQIQSDYPTWITRGRFWNPA